MTIKKIITSEIESDFKGVLDSHTYLWIIDQHGNKTAVLDTKNFLIWDVFSDNNRYAFSDANKKKSSEPHQQLNLDDWSVPSYEELNYFIINQFNPERCGVNNRIQECYAWVYDCGWSDTDETPISKKMASVNTGRIAWLNKSFSSTPISGLLLFLIENYLILQSNVIVINPLNFVTERIKFGDYDSVRLPKLDSSDLEDPNKGLWDFYGEEYELELRRLGIHARNPVDDVKQGVYVAIDFGTSSTVVAFEDQNQHKLLRIGVRDFYTEPKPEHYENPTVLEFLELAKLLDAWNSDTYRPLVNWDYVRCSHEAQTNFRDNEGDSSVLASILPKMKQWALRNSEDDVQTRITDRVNAEEMILPQLTTRRLKDDETLEVSDSDDFDPIELYAWFLGMNINWRRRGIFLNYYMTFPVDYPNEAKEKILASFSRGLQRSLPKALINQPVFNDFFVKERASEPAAYAASALERLSIEPTEEGTAYAVFDFGGGTADFDFGIYRWADEDEEDLGYEQVFEHFGSAGDKFLGGENLLENMAYIVFKDNLNLCREHQITFSKPLDAKEFSGSEMFIDRTQAAQTNSLMLMSALRPLWETGELPKANNAILKLRFLKRDDSNQSCDFHVNQEKLIEYLRNRIFEGVDNFYIAMQKAFKGERAETIHILLAGNSSKSELVKEIFKKTAQLHLDENKEQPSPETLPESDDELKALYIDLFGDVELAGLYSTFGEREAINILRSFGLQSLDALGVESEAHKRRKMIWGDNCPEIIVYPPLQNDPEDLYQPTCKTGVALGLLKLTPGSAIKVINHIAEETDGEAPFAYSLGQIRRKKFDVGIPQGGTYNQWTKLGPVREGVFRLVSTQSAAANTGSMFADDPSLVHNRITFSDSTEGHRVFAKAISPEKIELCTAVSLELVIDGNINNLQELRLGK